MLQLQSWWVLSWYEKQKTQRFQQCYFQLVSVVLLAIKTSTCRACKKGRGCCSLSRKRLRKIWNGKNFIQSNEWENLNVLRLQQIKTINGNVVIINRKNNGRIYIRLDFSHNNKRCKNHDLTGSLLPNLLNERTFQTFFSDHFQAAIPLFLHLVGSFPSHLSGLSHGELIIHCWPRQEMNLWGHLVNDEASMVLFRTPSTVLGKCHPYPLH